MLRFGIWAGRLLALGMFFLLLIISLKILLIFSVSQGVFWRTWAIGIGIGIFLTVMDRVALAAVLRGFLSAAWRTNGVTSLFIFIVYSIFRIAGGESRIVYFAAVFLVGLITMYSIYACLNFVFYKGLLKSNGSSAFILQVLFTGFGVVSCLWVVSLIAVILP